MNKIHLIGVPLIASLVLVPPLVMTLLNTEGEGQGWYWTPGDFLAALVLLCTAGFAFMILMSKVRTFHGRVIGGLLVLFTFSVVWAELAVGAVSQVVQLLRT